MRKLELWWQQAVLEDRFKGLKALERLLKFGHKCSRALESTPWKPPLPVLSIGSPFLGGSGKTPLTLWISQWLASQQQQVAIVSRGYRRQSKGQQIVSDGKGFLASIDISGDELLLMARRLQRAIVVADGDRKGGITEAHRRGANVVCLDDGFQHRSVYRDADIVVMQSDELQHATRLFPLGRLREPIDGIQRAHVCVVIYPTNHSCDLFKRPVWLPDRIPVVIARTRSLGFKDGYTNTSIDLPMHQPVAIFSSIARPDRFFKMIAAEGRPITGTWSEADHSAPDPYLFSHWVDVQKLMGAQVVLCTEKDAMHRLPGLSLPVVYVGIELEFPLGNELLVQLLQERLHVGFSRCQSC